MLSPSRRILMDFLSFYYPFGDRRFRNIFERGQLDDREERNFTKILFLGCGDLRNMFQAALPTKNVHIKQMHIHLNDSNYSIMARNILILKIISASDFNPDNQEDLSFLWDVWYNVEWPAMTRKRFHQALKDLLDGSLPENVVFTKSSQVQSLRKVWIDWLSASSKNQVDSNMSLSEMKKERSTFMVKCWNKLMPRNIGYAGVNPSVNESTISATVNEISKQKEIAMGIADIDDNLMQEKIRHEIRQYFKSGNCHLPNTSGFVCMNPTLLQSTSQRWRVHYALCPFDGYTPLTKEELDTSANEGILIKSCQNILKKLVSSYRNRMEDVKLFIHLEDALQFCYTEANLMFDIIDCSNLADHIGLANLINAACGKLSDLPGSRLLTETTTWNTLAPSVIQYLEEALCTPLSMIPSVYGLRLLNHVELGTPAPVNVDRFFMMEPVNLCWKKAPPLRNVALQSSPTLTRFLQQLARKCFTAAKEPAVRKAGEVWERCGMRSYTPLTFNYIVDSMIQRTGGSKWVKEARNHLNIPPVFRLHQRTMEAWKNGQKIVKLSTVNNLSSSETSFERFAASASNYAIGLFNDLLGTPVLRLVLIPFKTFNSVIVETEKNSLFKKLLEIGFLDRDAHYIDNFQLEMTKSSTDELATVSISFLMIPDHNLERTHGGFVVDMLTGVPFFYIQSVAFLDVEEFRVPYPHPRGPQLMLSPTPSPIVVSNCLESDNQYTLKILIGCNENVSGLKLSTDQKKPCESAHEVTLSLSQPNDIKPLTLSFSHPFLVDNIRATLHRQDRFLDLVLTKGVLEPWPCEFQVNENSKLNVDDLPPWEEEKKSSLDLHLSTQFSLYMSKTSPDSAKSALFQVRESIRTLFLALADGQEYFCVRRKSSSSKINDWHVRVHFPIRTSPTRSPLMMLTAFDNNSWQNQLSGSQAAEGKQDKEKAFADFNRIFHQAPLKKFTILTESEEESQLLRYVLRLNSTKMIPSAWQKENFSLGENSPWLATFLSPLYDEFQNRSSIPIAAGNTFSSSPTTIEEKKFCAFCQKTHENPKRCSRCRSIIYCSFECQRSHWSQHKISCFKK